VGPIQQLWFTLAVARYVTALIAVLITSPVKQSLDPIISGESCGRMHLNQSVTLCLLRSDTDYFLFSMENITPVGKKMHWLISYKLLSLRFIDRSEKPTSEIRFARLNYLGLEFNAFANPDFIGQETERLPYRSVTSQKFWEAKYFERATFFWGHRLSKHKMTRYARNLGVHGPITPLAPPMRRQYRLLRGV